jgi:Flavin containing amine oxidoreductase
MARTQLFRMHWPSAPFARGSYAAYRPGQTAFEGIEGRRVGRLHFCGEHTSVTFQGLMEGACATGAFTVQAVLHDMGLPTEHIMTALGVRLSSSHMAFSTPSQHGGTVRRRFPQQFPQAS